MGPLERLCAGKVLEKPAFSLALMVNPKTDGGADHLSVASLCQNMAHINWAGDPRYPVNGVLPIEWLKM